MRYLLLTYYRRPSGQVDESMSLSRNIKSRDLQTANVILDFRDQIVIKCNLDGVVIAKDWDHVVAYYYQHYSATIERLFKENGHELPVNK